MVVCVCFDGKFYHFDRAGATAILAAVNLEVVMDGPRLRTFTG
jgi:hypothetical protein